MVGERTIVGDRLEEHFASAIVSLKHPHRGIIRRGRLCQSAQESLADISFRIRTPDILPRGGVVFPRGGAECHAVLSTAPSVIGLA